MLCAVLCQCLGALDTVPVLEPMQVQKIIHAYSDLKQPSKWEGMMNGACMMVAISLHPRGHRGVEASIAWALMT
jgi:hypothetical protein